MVCSKTVDICKLQHHYPPVLNQKRAGWQTTCGSEAISLFFPSPVPDEVWFPAGSRADGRGRRPQITAATPFDNMEHLPSQPAQMRPPSCPPPRAHLPIPRHQRPARIDLTCEGSLARLSTDDHVLVLGSRVGARGGARAMRHADRRRTMPPDRARRQRARREGRIGGRERGCAKRAVVVMPLEQAGGPVFQTPLVSWTSSRALLKLFQEVIPTALEYRNRGRPLPSEKRGPARDLRDKARKGG